jgi:hypothetical protein
VSSPADTDKLPEPEERSFVLIPPGGVEPMVPSIDGPETPYYFAVGVIVTRGMRVQSGLAGMALVINEADHTKNIPVSVPLVSGKATEPGLADAINEQVQKMVTKIKAREAEIKARELEASDKQTPQVPKKHPVIGPARSKRRKKKDK